jgi:hypothetical protein
VKPPRCVLGKPHSLAVARARDRCSRWRSPVPVARMQISQQQRIKCMGGQAAKRCHALHEPCDAAGWERGRHGAGFPCYTAMASYRIVVVWGDPRTSRACHASVKPHPGRHAMATYGTVRAVAPRRLSWWTRNITPLPLARMRVRGQRNGLPTQLSARKEVRPCAQFR